MTQKTSIRIKADSVKPFLCRYLVAILENPKDLKNIGSVIRNVNALGVEKVYIIDPDDSVPDDWEDMRQHVSLLKKSASAIKWSFVKKFKSTTDCIFHLKKNGYKSIATSPHQKGKKNIFLQDGKYTQKKLAVWFGNETSGISDEALLSCETCVSIPMFGIVESLNLATSSGIVLYEVSKQRRMFESQRKIEATNRKSNTK